MKKYLTILFVLAALLALTAPAFADVLWEPNNRFYEKHRDECESVVRTFYANGPEGFVTLWDAPGGSSVQAQYENGTALMVYWQYQDWGCVYERGDIEGWVPMDQLALRYDGRSFAEEYEDFITDYNGEFADYAGGAEVIYFYAYPGAPKVGEQREAGGDWHVLDNLTGRGGEKSYISKIFVDEEGRTWGYVSYMYGRLNAWFCLDEPDGRDFPVREVPEAYLTPAQPPRLPARGYLPYVLVGAAVLVTGGILLALLRKRKRR